MMRVVDAISTPPLADPNQIPLREVMSTDLLIVYEGWSIKRLVDFFDQHQITGAPVVASDGELVGVVTLTDVLRFQSHPPDMESIQAAADYYCGEAAQHFTEEDFRRLRDRASTTCTVNSIMTPEVLAIEVESSLASACAHLLEERIHRLFVTDEKRLVGVITAMDCLRIVTFH
jgi:predicted transcriptional regulator